MATVSRGIAVTADVLVLGFDGQAPLQFRFYAIKFAMVLEVTPQPFVGSTSPHRLKANSLVPARLPVVG